VLNQSYEVQNPNTQWSNPASSNEHSLGFSPLSNQRLQLLGLPQCRYPQLHAQSVAGYIPTTQVSASLRPQVTGFFNQLETMYPSSGPFLPSQLPNKHQYYTIPQNTPSLEHRITNLLMPYQSSSRLTRSTQPPHLWNLATPNYSYVSMSLPSCSSVAAPHPYSASQAQKILLLLNGQEQTPAQMYFPKSQIPNRSAQFKNSAPSRVGDPHAIWTLQVPEILNHGLPSTRTQPSQVLNNSTSSSNQKRGRPNGFKIKKSRNLKFHAVHSCVHRPLHFLIFLF